MTKGGFRATAGNKSNFKQIPDQFKKSKLTNANLPKWIINWINEQPKNPGQIIEEALKNYYNLKPPKIQTKINNPLDIFFND